MEWVVAIGCVKEGFLSNPNEFLLRPDTRACPHWVCGVVSAEARNSAFDLGEKAFREGQLTGRQPDDVLINWYVTPLNGPCDRHDDASIVAVKREQEPPRDATKWVVALSRVSASFLSNPAEFLSNPDRRIQPSWACGIVEAADESAAYDAGEDAWYSGLIADQQPGDELMNWYVAPLVDRHSRI